MRSNRPQHWPTLLADYLTAQADRPFVWGRHDCATFSAGWMLTLGYPSPIAGLAWSSALTALRLMRAHGGYAELITARLGPLGCERIAPVLAQRGDLVLVPIPAQLDRYSLGIVSGSMAHVVGPSGCHPVPYHTSALAAYSV
jgi:hypothetical protein